MKNGGSEVEINDRGPYAAGRKIDLSKSAAEKLDILDDGTAPVGSRPPKNSSSPATRTATSSAFTTSLIPPRRVVEPSDTATSKKKAGPKPR